MPDTSAFWAWTAKEPKIINSSSADQERKTQAWPRSLGPASMKTALSMPSRKRPTSTSRCGRRSEEHTSELQSLMRNSYAVFCLKKKKQKHQKEDKQKEVH